MGADPKERTPVEISVTRSDSLSLNVTCDST